MPCRSPPCRARSPCSSGSGPCGGRGSRDLRALSAVKDVSIAGDIYQDLRCVEALSQEAEWVYGGARPDHAARRASELAARAVPGRGRHLGAGGGLFFYPDRARLACRLAQAERPGAVPASFDRVARLAKSGQNAPRQCPRALRQLRAIVPESKPAAGGALTAVPLCRHSDCGSRFRSLADPDCLGGACPDGPAVLAAFPVA